MSQEIKYLEVYLILGYSLYMEYIKFIRAEVEICMTLSYSTKNAIAEKYSIMC